MKYLYIFIAVVVMLGAWLWLCPAGVCTAAPEAMSDERVMDDAQDTLPMEEVLPEEVFEPLERPVEASVVQLGATHDGLREYTSPADLHNLSGTNILFFKASWCVTCKALYDAIKSEDANIPHDVTIWIVDYDREQEMRRTYGVTTQHTLAQIDTAGNKVNLWRGGFSLNDVLSNIK